MKKNNKNEVGKIRENVDFGYKSKRVNVIDILTKICLMIVLLFCFTNTANMVKAENAAEDIINAGNRFMEEGQSGAENMGFTKDTFVDGFIGIGQILVAIGTAILVGVVLFMAIKWITAKPDQVATLKQQTIGIVVAAVVIFGAVGIWNLVYSIMTNVQSSIGG